MKGIYTTSVNESTLDDIILLLTRRQRTCIMQLMTRCQRCADAFPAEAHLFAKCRGKETVDVKAEFEKLYFDIAGDPEPVQLSMLRMVIADDHIVYGSDFPYSPAKVILAKKKHFDDNKEFDGIREKIYSENAVRLLKGVNV